MNSREERLFKIIQNIASKDSPTFQSSFIAQIENGMIPDRFEFSVGVVFRRVLESSHLGELITRIETKGIKLLALETVVLTEEILRAVYEEYSPEVMEQILSRSKDTRAAIMVLSGYRLYENLLRIKGYYIPLRSRTGSIRDMYGESLHTDIAIHCSMNEEEFQRDLEVFFPNIAMNNIRAVNLCLRKN